MHAPSSSGRALPTIMAIGVAFSLAAGAAVITSAVSATPAAAHAALVTITPAADAQLTAGPAAVVLEFDEPVSTTFATVVVTTAAGVDATSGKPTTVGAKVRQALSPNLSSGNYRIAYRVVSDDGHPVTGESHFSLELAVKPGPSSTAGTTGSGSMTAASPSRTGPSVGAAELPSREGLQGDQIGSLSRYPFPLVGIIGLLVIGAGVLLWRRRQR